jgi:hypothetical protein
MDLAMQPGVQRAVVRGKRERSNGFDLLGTCALIEVVVE